MPREQRGFLIPAITLCLACAVPAAGTEGTLQSNFSPATGIGAEEKVMRRDPGDIIKVGELYYVWYSRGRVSSGYNATVWYATSPDGRTWTEKGEALARGAEGCWDERSVFTPNILEAEEKYWLFYTAVPSPFDNNTRTAIGIALSDSPDGPWTKLESNPVLRSSDDPAQFDSMRVDDACLMIREGRYWFYYKGRQMDHSPMQTKMGVAIAEKPQGPYVKYEKNPVVGAGHEVLVWPMGKGVGALIGRAGPAELKDTVQYAEDGLHFSRYAKTQGKTFAPGAYRPEAFTQSGEGKLIEWGVHIGTQKGFLPFIERFDCRMQAGMPADEKKHE